MPEQGISQDVFQKIIDTFSQNLREHLFSDMHYPEEVTIRTVYKDCSQSLTVKFATRKESEGVDHGDC